MNLCDREIRLTLGFGEGFFDSWIILSVKLFYIIKLARFNRYNFWEKFWIPVAI